MTKKSFTRTELRNHYGLPFSPDNGAVVVVNEIYGQTLLTNDYRLVFRLPGMPENEAWETGYSVGATEQQDERPWEHDDTIECTLVEHKSVTRVQWVPKSNA
jgi:hypothetical protein